VLVASRRIMYYRGEWWEVERLREARDDVGKRKEAQGVEGSLCVGFVG